MNKEEIKQYLRNLINSSVKIRNFENMLCLCYNKQYLRALNLSKFTGKPVNKEDFNSWIELFYIDAKDKEILNCEEITNFLIEIYSNDYAEHAKIIEEVINDTEYKGYTYF